MPCMPWWLAIFLGSVVLTVLWFLERTRDLSFTVWATQMLPVLLVCELCYWYGFRKAPSFLSARYTMSAMTHTLGWVLALCILREGVTWRSVAGAVLIIGGALLVGK